MHHIFLLVIML